MGRSSAPERARAALQPRGTPFALYHPVTETTWGLEMLTIGIRAALVGAATLGFASQALAQTAPAAAPGAEPAKPFEYTPWYEAKILPAPLSATIAFWSNYRFRGISQTSNAPGYNGS